MSNGPAPYLELIRLKVREYMNECADHLAGGGAQDYEEYKFICGKVEALALIEREILDLSQKLVDE